MSNTWWRSGTVMFFLFAIASLGVATTDSKEEAARFGALLKQHHQNISTPEGKGYEKAFMNQYQARYGTVLGDCIQKSGAPASFNMILVIGKDGRVINGVTKSRSSLAECVIRATQKDAFPKPPFAPFHINIEQSFEP